MEAGGAAAGRAEATTATALRPADEADDQDGAASGSRTDADSARGPSGAPDDADDLRGYHFRELLHKPLTWVLVGGGSLLLGVVLARRLQPGGRRDRLRRRLPRSASGSPSTSPTRAPPTTSSTSTPQQRDLDPRRQDLAAAGDAAAAQGRRPVRRADADRGDRARRRRHPRDLHLRHRIDRQQRQHRQDLPPVHAGDDRRPRVRRPRAGALLPAQERPAVAGEVRGRLPHLQTAGRAGERGARRPLRDLLRQGPGRGLAAAALLPDLHRLADRIGRRTSSPSSWSPAPSSPTCAGTRKTPPTSTRSPRRR